MISEAKKITDRLEGIDRCASCGEEIIWTRTKNGKAMPVNLRPVDDGTILLKHMVQGEPPDAHCVGKDERGFLEKQSRNQPLRLFKSHFSTCPDSEKWRKR